MKKIFLLLSLAFLLYSCSEKPMPQKIALVPEPVSIEQDSLKNFILDKHTKLSFLNLSKDSETQKYIVENYKHYFGFEPKVQNSPVRNIIIFELNDEKNDQLGDEGYQLTVDKKIILI